MSTPPPAARGRSTWAPRLLVLSTIALLVCFAVPEDLRGPFAFVWVLLAIAAFALEWTARRRARGPRRRRVR